MQAASGGISGKSFTLLPVAHDVPLAAALLHCAADLLHLSGRLVVWDVVASDLQLFPVEHAGVARPLARVPVPQDHHGFEHVVLLDGAGVTVVRHELVEHLDRLAD